MKKLVKKVNRISNTVEAYEDLYAMCGCECTCKCACQRSSSKIKSNAYEKDESGFKSAAKYAK